MASPNELSFLPDDYLERKAQRRTNAICAVLFLIVMVTIGTTFSFDERATRAVEQEHETTEKLYAEAAKRLELVNQLKDKQRRMAEQAELAASLLEKVPRSNLLAEITNALPVGVSLLDLGMDSKVRGAPSAAGAAGAGGKTPFEQKRTATDAKKKAAEAAAAALAPKVYDITLKVSGVAYTDVQVAQFMSKLNQCPLLADVSLVISDEYKRGEEQLRKFQIEAKLDPKAEVTASGISDGNKTTAAVEVKETR